MPSREVEVVTYLRTDATLATLAPGGIYVYADLGVEGIADSKYAEDVWAGGIFNTSILVKQGAPVPTGDLQSVMSQLTSMSQVIEIWVYGLTADAIQAVFTRVYTLMMGHNVGDAFSATQGRSGTGIGQAPELPTGILTNYEGYRVFFIRRPALA